MWQTLNQVGTLPRIQAMRSWLVVRVPVLTVVAKFSNCCGQEIPYDLRQKITSWKTSPGASAWLAIECDVIVPRNHLKAIVIGKDGNVVSRVSQAAAAEMQQRFQRPVSLAISVKSSV